MGVGAVAGNKPMFAGGKFRIAEKGHDHRDTRAARYCRALFDGHGGLCYIEISGG